MTTFDARPTNALLSILERPRTGAGDQRLLAVPSARAMLRVFGVTEGHGERCLDAARTGRIRVGVPDAEKRFVRYLVHLGARRAKLIPLLTELARSQESIPSAVRRAERYLPRTGLIRDTKVVFLPLRYDARTDGSVVYFDPLLALSIGRTGVEALLSHELHHVARYRLTGRNLSGLRPLRLRDRATFRAAVRLWASFLEMEGIADRVFDLRSFHLPVHRRMLVERAWVTTHAAQAVRRGEAALLELKERRPRRPLERSPVLEIVLPLAHPVGALMARTVEERFGRGRLAQCVGAPGEFLRTYQLAARPSNEFTFREELLAVAGEP